MCLHSGDWDQVGGWVGGWGRVGDWLTGWGRVGDWVGGWGRVGDWLGVCGYVVHNFVFMSRFLMILVVRAVISCPVNPMCDCDSVLQLYVQEKDRSAVSFVLNFFNFFQINHNLCLEFHFRQPNRILGFRDRVPYIMSTRWIHYTCIYSRAYTLKRLLHLYSMHSSYTYTYVYVIPTSEGWDLLDHTNQSQWSIKINSPLGRVLISFWPIRAFDPGVTWCWHPRSVCMACSSMRCVVLCCALAVATCSLQVSKFKRLSYILKPSKYKHIWIPTQPFHNMNWVQKWCTCQRDSLILDAFTKQVNERKKKCRFLAQFQKTLFDKVAEPKTSRKLTRIAYTSCSLSFWRQDGLTRCKWSPSDEVERVRSKLPCQKPLFITGVGYRLCIMFLMLEVMFSADASIQCHTTKSRSCVLMLSAPAT